MFFDENSPVCRSFKLNLVWALWGLLQSNYKKPQASKSDLKCKKTLAAVVPQKLPRFSKENLLNFYWKQYGLLWVTIVPRLVGWLAPNKIHVNNISSPAVKNNGPTERQKQKQTDRQKEKRRQTKACQMCRQTDKTPQTDEQKHKHRNYESSDKSTDRNKWKGADNNTNEQKLTNTRL